MSLFTVAGMTLWSCFLKLMGVWGIVIVAGSRGAYPDQGTILPPPSAVIGGLLDTCRVKEKYIRNTTFLSYIHFASNNVGLL